MTLNQLHALAAGLALGTLNEADRERARALEKANPEFKAAVEALESILVPLAATIPPVLPPPGLFKKIESRVSGQEAPCDGTVTLRVEEQTWLPIADGVDMVHLWHNAAANRKSMLIRMQPGAYFPSHDHDHDHDQDEECLLLKGDLVFGNLVLRAGDFHVAPRGCAHPQAYSPSGCLCMVNTAA